MYDLIIIGGGPAGAAAGVYAARKKLKTALIAESFGGQSLVSADVQNWIGTKSVSGLELAKMLEEHLRAQEDLEIISPDLVVKLELVRKPSFVATGRDFRAKDAKPDEGISRDISRRDERLAAENIGVLAEYGVSGQALDKNGAGFKIFAQSGKILECRTVLIASGSRRRKLGIPGEKEFDGKGVSYCSTCDAPIFKNKTTAVIGGGNAGLEAAIDLLVYSPKVYILEYADQLKGDPATQEKIKSDSRAEIILNAKTLKILGDKFVSGLQYQDLKSNQIKEIKTEGVFIEIGSVPNAEFVKHLVKTNPAGEIIVDHKTQQTSQAGIWAAGDVTDVLYKQNNISAGDAVKAVLNIYSQLTTNNK